MSAADSRRAVEGELGRLGRLGIGRVVGIYNVSLVETKINARSLYVALLATVQLKQDQSNKLLKN
jgi:hypothetical protein